MSFMASTGSELTFRRVMSINLVKEGFDETRIRSDAIVLQWDNNSLKVTTKNIQIPLVVLYHSWILRICCYLSTAWIELSKYLDITFRQDEEGRLDFVIDYSRDGLMTATPDDDDDSDDDDSDDNDDDDNDDDHDDDADIDDKGGGISVHPSLLG